MVYIYSLKHPITNEVRYIGKTINVKRRYKQHLYDKRNSHKANWVRSLRNEGLKPIMEVIEICTDNWQEREIFWISQFNNLTNFSKGGGIDYVRTTTEETRIKISEANKGKSKTEEHKAKLSKGSQKKQISINNVVYNSVTEASKILGINWTTIYMRVKSKHFVNYFYL